MENIFQELNAVNVGDHIEKKQNLSYLSWAWAWAELKKRCPDANFTIIHNVEGLNYHTDGKTCWVEVEVTVGNLKHGLSLPVMDYRNQSIPLDKVTSMDVNKAIMRCLAKCIALHGLGLYIYAGEDLPEDEGSATEPRPPMPLPETQGQNELHFICTECGKIINPVTFKGKEYSVRRIAAVSSERYGKPMCWECMTKKKEEKENA